MTDRDSEQFKDFMESDRMELTTDDFYTRLEEIEMGDIEFQHARPAHIKVAQQAVYFQSDHPFRAASLKREREYTERVTAFLLPKSDLTYVFLIRNGDQDDGHGRTYYIAQHAGAVADLQNLINNHGFESTSIVSDFLLEDLPDAITAPFEDESDDEVSDADPSIQG